MCTAIWESEKGTFIRFLVRPNSKEREFIVGISSENVMVNLKSPARQGKANTELVKRLTKVLGISTSSVRLVSGHKTKEKTLLIHGLGVQDVQRMLANMT
ncbi:MAG: DUF167 domain-containing protein [Candidatus Thorarchaeota archaeon]